MGGERSGGLPCTFILFGLFEEVALHRLLQHENLMTMVSIIFTMYCNFVTMKCELVATALESMTYLSVPLFLQQQAVEQTAGND